MPKEVRVIQFEQHEVLLAAQTFMSERSGSRDTAAIVHVTFTQGSDGVMGELHSLRPGEPNNRIMSAEDMLVAMLLFCSRKRIPLPIRSAKRLELHGSSLILKITVPSR